MHSSIHPVHTMPRDVAMDADTVSTYQMTDGPQAGMTVVEVLNAHRVVIGRSIVDAPGAREDVADLTLGRSPVERCANWAIDPIGKGKRSTAMVILRTTSGAGSLDALRARHEMNAS